MQSWRRYVSLITLVCLRGRGNSGCEVILVDCASAHVNVSGIVNIIAQGKTTVKCIEHSFQT